MSNLVFPSLPGLQWGIRRAPKFATTIQAARSGKEVRILEQAAPRWSWELSYSFLSDDRTAGESDLMKLGAFFQYHRGAFESFRYLDADDQVATDAAIGTGNGTQTSFQLARSFGTTTPWLEPITEINGTPTVKVNGVAVTATLGAAGVVTLAVPPANGAAVTASFAYWWRVRFDSDSLDVEQFLSKMWKCQSLKLVQVL